MGFAGGNVIKSILESSSWYVYINNRYTGIIETNYKYASNYWKSRYHNERVELRKCQHGKPSY